MIPKIRRWNETFNEAPTAPKARGLLAALLITILIALSSPAPLYAQDDPVAEFYEVVNQARLNEGLPPFGISTLLHQAAQRHAEDLAERGSTTHEGSDGSGYRQRIREARYQAWNDGLLVNEAFWMGLGSAEDAVTWFRTNPAWELFTDTKYREIGVGYAEANGVRYFVVNFGSRPGVLPIFINDGAATTDSPQVALRLTNEDAVPLGEGAWMGRAIEVRLSNAPDFDGQPWQPWEPLLPWLLEGTEPGDYAVYAEFRDGAGRTAIAEDTIRLVETGEAPPTPTPLPELPEVTPEATSATAPGDTESPTPAATPPGEASPTTGDGDVQPTGAPATSVPAAPTVPAATMTPFPTWTPLPEETPVVIETTSTDWPLILALSFQGLAALLGFAAFLRRR
jgi:uncharacterized protein YkwD